MKTDEEYRNDYISETGKSPWIFFPKRLGGKQLTQNYANWLRHKITKEVRQ
jgi:hypothetical protein